MCCWFSGWFFYTFNSSLYPPYDESHMISDFIDLGFYWDKPLRMLALSSLVTHHPSQWRGNKEVLP